MNESRRRSDGALVAATKIDKGPVLLLLQIKKLTNLYFHLSNPFARASMSVLRFLFPHSNVHSPKPCYFATLFNPIYIRDFS